MTTTEPERRLLPTANLKVVSATNTRQNNEARVKKILADFKPYLFQDLDVAPNGTGNTFEVLDGGTRLRVARERGMNSVWCRVHWHAKDESTKADVFLGINEGRTALSHFERFLARITEKDPVAVGTKEIVVSRGLVLAQGGGFKNGITCTQSLAQAFEWGTLERTLDTILAVWDSGKVRFNRNLVAGLAAMFKMYPELPQARVEAKLGALGPVGLSNLAKQSQELAGGTLWRHVAKVAKARIEAGLSDAKKLPEREFPKVSDKAMHSYKPATSRGL